MRFLFENGGRSGMRAAEDMGHGLKTWLKSPEFGCLYLDFSLSYDGLGELFRTEDQMTDDLADVLQAIKVRDRVQGMLTYAQEAEASEMVGLSYWAEAEALGLARSIAAEAPPAGPANRL